MRNSILFGVFLSLVLATGATGLVYQVASERYLARVVGGDHLATALVLAVFLGGLAAGYLLCGRLTLRVSNHVAVYAALEAFIGLWALGFPRLFEGISGVTGSWSFAYPWGLLGQGLVVTWALVLPPTLAMGATVPFLTRALAARSGEVSRVHAAVYGVNTIGAGAGALTAGFWLVPAFGLPGTMWRAGSVNLLVAAALAVIAWTGAFRGRPAETAGGDGTPTTRLRFRPGVLHVVAFLNGFAVLSLEATTIRFAKLALGSSTYTFAMLVAVFVVSLAAGSIAVSRARSLPAWLPFAVQITAAIYLLLLYTTLDEWPYWAHLLRIGFSGSGTGFVLYHGALFSVLLAVLVVPVALLGATLPILYGELGPRLAESGWFSGRLLAWNGLGTMLGSLSGGALLYFVTDGARIFLLTPVLAACAACLVSRPVGAGLRAGAVTIAVLGTLVLVVRPFHDPSRLAVGTFRIRAPLPFSYAGPRIFFEELQSEQQVLVLREDPLATVAVLARQGGDSNSGPLSLMINGKSESNTKEDEQTLRLLAHLPALWAAERRRVLVVGLGTGVTAGELSLYPDIERIDVAEISPATVELLPMFASHTHAVHEDPRLAIAIGDALLSVRRATVPWDIIVSEPSNPWVAGVDHLFSREFYRLVGSHLTDEGLFVQWLQLYESSFEILAMVLNTLKEEFPAVHAFRATTGDLLLLAGKRPFTTEDRLRAEATLESLPVVRDSLAEIGVESIDAILQREVRTLEAILAQSEPHGVNAMDHPRLHYLAGRAMFEGSRVSEPMLDGVVDLDFLWADELRRMRGGSGGGR